MSRNDHIIASFIDARGTGFKVKAAGVEGTVLDVDIRKTRIIDSNGILHVIPNATIEPAEWLVFQKAEKKPEQT